MYWLNKCLTKLGLLENLLILNNQVTCLLKMLCHILVRTDLIIFRKFFNAMFSFAFLWKEFLICFHPIETHFSLCLLHKFLFSLVDIFWNLLINLLVYRFLFFFSFHCFTSITNNYNSLMINHHKWMEDMFTTNSKQR